MLAIVGALFIVSCSSSQPKSLTILHTNDIHASFLPHEAFWVKSDPKPMVGGFDELSWMVDSIKKVKGDVLLLDGGDVMTGSPISEIDYQGSTGGALFEMMNKVGYDAWTIGNHDLDISQDNLRQHTGIVHFPTVSANLTDSSGNFPFNNKEYVILNKNGLRIGIIGLMTPDLYSVTNTKNLHGLKVLSPSEVTQKLIDKIKDQVDVTVVLSHEGVDVDSTVAANTHGLNIIIGGHSHTRLKTPKVVNGVIICQTGSNCENLGELEVTVENKKVTHFDGKLHQLWLRHDRRDDELKALVDKFKTQIDKEYGEVIGTLVSDWRRGGRDESNIGDFMVDAIREGANADLAIANSSSLRKDLSAGPIRKLDLFEIMPFRNTLCTFTMSGKEVKAFAERYAKAIRDGSASTQVSGMKCAWKSSDNGIAVQHLTINGKEIDDNKSYTCATSDFAVNQAEKYLGFVPSGVNYAETTILQTMLDKVRKDKSVDSKIERRFEQVP
jgi:2',3'-cyclic-nucleotide 2'-phosphodiesterase (5'-nucleotidase family)